jgi:hypothetical protein
MYDRYAFMSLAVLMVSSCGTVFAAAVDATVLSCVSLREIW